jgi:phenylpyruvate tautomerase PptA (4-oxalocrotonate tautomerase family)
LTDLTALHLGKRPEVTAVMIDDLPASDWGYGGQTQAQRRMVRALSSL